jgi:hypothetical protein
METTQKVSSELNLEDQLLNQQFPQVAQEKLKIQVIFKKLRGGFFFVIGYLLSPLCWWNDLIFNLPVAYFFGYICSLLSPDLLVPCSIVGYWLSNVAGIVLMQVGAVDVLQGQAKERNLKKELMTGLLSSTAYTLVIMALIYFNIFDTPTFLFTRS